MENKGKHHLQFFDSAERLACSAAREWFKTVGDVSGDGPFHVAVSGGRIAVPFLKEAARLFLTTPELLNRLHIYWADERCVPPDSDDSNFRMFQECFVQPTQLPESRLFRFKGEANPEEAALWMSDQLSNVLPLNASNTPIMDLIILGMGEDGHVASLFPENMEEDIKKTEHTFSVVASKPPPHRLTLSYPILHTARNVWVVISGKGKEGALRDALQGGGRNPLARVIEGRISTEIFTDIDLNSNESV